MAAAPSSCVLRPGPIANCQVYSANNACLVCAAGFKFSPVSGSCDAFTGTIANCQLYNANQGCVTCASGYVVNPDNNACVALSANANCLFYTYLGCRACASGFVVNPNLYFANFNSASTSRLASALSHSAGPIRRPTSRPCLSISSVVASRSPNLMSVMSPLSTGKNVMVVGMRVSG